MAARFTKSATRPETAEAERQIQFTVRASMGKLATAKRVLQTQGVAGLIPVFKHKLQYVTNLFDPWDNWFCGKFVELRGGIVSIDGCSFDVNSPVISTRLKSRFLFNNYETPEREALELFLDPALPVVELGGSVGVVA